MQNADPSQSSLIDLLRPLRTRWWLVLAIAAVAAAVSLGLSVSKKKRYTAVASFQVHDATQDLGLLGVGLPAQLTAAQLASQAAQTITQPAVVARAKQALGLPASSQTPSVTATVDPNASDVHVQATALTPDAAAANANAFVQAAVRATTYSQRKLYADDVTALAGRKRKIDSTALRELRTLAAIAAPAQVTGVATPPGAPSSPRPLRHGALAGVLGLLVGLLAVYAVDAIDQRLRSTHELERELGYDLVGRVRESALGHSPTSKEADKVVDAVDWEQFRILQRNLDFMASNGGGPRTIAVTSSMPEEGKTTVACFVAFANAATGRRTLLVECDLRRPVLAERLGIRSGPGLTDFATGEASPEGVLQVVSFSDVAVRNGSGIKQPDDSEPEVGAPYSHQLVCITAGSPTEHPVEILTSQLVRRMFDEVRDAYDVVIYDTPPLLVVVDTLEVIEQAEAIIVCGRAARLTRAQARAGKNALQRLSDRPIGLVVTGLTPSRGSGYGYDGYYSYYAKKSS